MQKGRKPNGISRQEQSCAKQKRYDDKKRLALINSDHNHEEWDIAQEEYAILKSGGIVAYSSSKVGPL